MRVPVHFWVHGIVVNSARRFFLFWINFEPIKVWRRRKRDWSSTPSYLDSIIRTLSDQLLFTGAAYAIILRYSPGCTISVYHYHILAHIFEISCATQLPLVFNMYFFWKNPVTAALRTTVLAYLLLTTVLSFNSMSSTLNLPPEHSLPNIPELVTSDPSFTDSLVFLPAMCFPDPTALKLDDQLDPMPMLMTILRAYYIIAFITHSAELINYFLNRRYGKRIGEVGPSSNARFKHCAFRIQQALYILKHLSILSIPVFLGVILAHSVSRIISLRKWVSRSGWLVLQNGRNPEDVASSIGQLITIFMTSLTLLSIVQIVTKEGVKRRRAARSGNESAAKDEDEESSGALLSGTPPNDSPQIISPTSRRSSISFPTNEQYKLDDIIVSIERIEDGEENQ
ncbi:hypothetical protein F5Y15DRAFT_263841 [Xylariaceae sp. FL0016]|nr:hypothetical protein F5Y15DRAFT_263841 [Xylariaceae sp. FL0016]